MSFSDFLFIANWWLLFLLIGLLFLPLSSYFFRKFIDKGYIFSKTIGIVSVSYLIFVFGTIHIVQFTRLNSIFLLLLLGLLNYFLFWHLKIKTGLLLKKVWGVILLEEILFFISLFFWSYVRAHQSDIHGLEKYMDLGFINSILRADYFPPRDMWFTPFYINYYYFGHLITAVLTKISGIPSFITFNLMLATIFALSFTGVFSLGINLISQIKFKDPRKMTLHVLAGGFLAAFLVNFAGNLHTIYTFFKPYVNENPVPFWQLVFSPQSFPNLYWYPNATRFIFNTIHEFPIYSFVVSDLHGHVLDIPIVLTTLALLFSFFLSFNKNNKLPFQFLIILSFSLAVMYMTNAWDGLIYILLSIFIFLYFWRENLRVWFFSMVILVLGFVVFTLPFDVYFKPFVSGIGILCAPEFLTSYGKLGPFLFEQSHCQKSPIWQLLILYGFFYFWIFSFIIFLKKRKDIVSSDIFVIILIIISTLLIIIPEFIYAKDIYPAHYRANTMFKLVYQSFIMLSLSSAYIIIRLLLAFKNSRLNTYNKISGFLFWIFAGLTLFFVFIYPYFAVNSYYSELKTYIGLDGISYLNKIYPDDYLAILWLNKNVQGQPVILEAQGDSYTDFARISSNTGLPTVLGWTVHEWLWRGTYDVPAPRIEEIKNLYETSDINLTEDLIKKYNISLVFIGNLEREKYPLINEKKFADLGKVVFQSGLTVIYKINPSTQ